MPPKPHTALLYVGGAALLWGMVGALSRWISWDPAATSAVSSLLGVVVLLFWMISGDEWDFSKPRLQLATAAAVAGSLILFLLAFQYTLVSRAQALNLIHPVVTLLITAWLEHKRPRWAEALLCTAGLAGVVLVSADSIWSGSFHLGDLLSMLSAVCFSISFVMQPQLGSTSRSLTATTIGMVLAVLILLPCWLLAPPPLPAPLQVLGLAILALLIAVPTVLFSIGAPHVRPSLAGPLMNGEFVVGVLAGVLLFNERPSAVAWCGMALILACAIVIAWRTDAASDTVPEESCGVKSRVFLTRGGAAFFRGLF